MAEGFALFFTFTVLLALIFAFVTMVVLSADAPLPHLGVQDEGLLKLRSQLSWRLSVQVLRRDTCTQEERRQAIDLFRRLALLDLHLMAQNIQAMLKSQYNYKVLETLRSNLDTFSLRGQWESRHPGARACLPLSSSPYTRLDQHLWALEGSRLRHISVDLHELVGSMSQAERQMHHKTWRWLHGRIQAQLHYTASTDVKRALLRTQAANPEQHAHDLAQAHQEVAQARVPQQLHALQLPQEEGPAGEHALVELLEKAQDEWGAIEELDELLQRGA